MQVFLIILEMLLFILQIEYSLAAFHDSVILYAFVLNETLSAGGDITDGMVVVDRLRDRDFYLYDGNVVFIIPLYSRTNHYVY